MTESKLRSWISANLVTIIGALSVLILIKSCTGLSDGGREESLNNEREEESLNKEREREIAALQAKDIEHIISLGDNWGKHGAMSVSYCIGIPHNEHEINFFAATGKTRADSIRYVYEKGKRAVRNAPDGYCFIPITIKTDFKRTCLAVAVASARRPSTLEDVQQGTSKHVVGVAETPEEAFTEAEIACWTAPTEECAGTVVVCNYTRHTP